jgi:hypothetical protein
MPDSTFNETRCVYRLYGLAVESALRLTSAEPWPDEGVTPAVRIAFGTPEVFARKAAGLREDCEDWIRHVVLADGSVYIRVNEVFEAIVAPYGRDVVCAPLGEVDERTFEANLANFALSASLTLQGEECLHATVVAVGGRAVGLLGPSGSGKSTLSAFLLAHGAALVTDDMLRVTLADDGAILAHPGPHRLKLFDDSAARLLPDASRDGSFNRLSSKRMFEPGGACGRVVAPVPLAALFWLGEPEPPVAEGEVAIRRLSGIEPVKVLTASTMNRRYVAADRLVRQLRFAERLARALPIHALRYRRDYEVLDRVARAMDESART